MVHTLTSMLKIKIGCLCVSFFRLLLLLFFSLLRLNINEGMSGAERHSLSKSLIYSFKYRLFVDFVK